MQNEMILKGRSDLLENTEVFLLYAFIFPLFFTFGKVDTLPM